jgi:hypothetical protein
MKPLYIFDLDGTLANADHRIHYISGEKKNWRAFFAACVDDEPIAPAIATLKALRRGGAEVWIWTGRSDEVRTQTIEWLVKHGCFGGTAETLPWWPFGAPERFRMRQAGDLRPDHVIKGEWLALLDPPEYGRLTAVFEDRERVVRMWRDSGVACYQVASGDF